ncbi:MAG TPA: ECF transporter S component [Clostridia bacterium]|nr:ECF transporter S component [Clostridia bacterium]
MEKRNAPALAMNHEKLRSLVLAAILSALIVVMTVVPYTGYITIPVLSLEITTLHIVVALGACLLGWKYGAVLGGVWGVTCLIRAFTNPLWIMFTNPLISVLPRIFVGVVGGLVFAAMKKSKAPEFVDALVAAIAATLTNTVLVLGAIYAFGGMLESYAQFFEIFKAAFAYIITINGLVELAAAAVIVPIVYRAILPALKRGKRAGEALK